MPSTPLNFLNPSFGTRNYATAGVPGAANPNLGTRDQTGLANAFGTSPIIRNHYGESDAAVAFQQYSGENEDFAHYSRSFVPAGGVPEELYTNVRAKNLTDADVAAAKLGTPYSPTVGSPGAGNGFDPNSLPDVAGLVPAAAQPSTLNPRDAAYQNYGTGGGDIGTAGPARIFKLGVGSAFGNTRGV